MAVSALDASGQAVRPSKQHAMGGSARQAQDGPPYTREHGRDMAERWEPAVRVRRTPRALSDASATIGFELEQLVEVVITLRSTARDPWPTVAVVALQESALVHARNLIEFLIGRLRNDLPCWSASSMAPRDFVPGWSLDDASTERLREALSVADLWLAHLTWDRIDGTWGRYDWEPWLPALVLHAVASFSTAAHQRLGVTVESLRDAVVRSEGRI
jgi:hypothetical protein